MIVAGKSTAQGKSHSRSQLSLLVMRILEMTGTWRRRPMTVDLTFGLLCMYVVFMYRAWNQTQCIGILHIDCHL